MKTFRIIISGSRTFNDYNLLKEKTDYILSNVSKDHKIIVVSGTANGADKLGERYAEEKGYEIQRFPAHWDELGKRAGMVRNAGMAKVSDGCICFWDGKSKGTKGMIDLAIKYGIKLKVVQIEEG